MNINLHPIGKINYSLLNNVGYKYNNLSPLSRDTVSFGASKKVTVNIGRAKDLIAKFQQPDFNTNGQHSIDEDELKNVLVYCGCIETTGGKHGRHIETPLGQTYPLTTSDDVVEFAGDVISAVKKLDTNYGEIIFTSNIKEEQIAKLRAKAKSQFEQAEAGKFNSLRQINYYQIELREKRIKEQKENEAAEQAKQAKNEKLSQTQASTAKVLTKNITTYINNLEEIKTGYREFNDEVKFVINTALSTEDDKALPDNGELAELRKELKENLEQKVEQEITERIEQINKDIESVKPQNGDTIQNLEEKQAKVMELSEDRGLELVEYKEEKIKIIKEKIKNSSYKDKLDNVLLTVFKISDNYQEVQTLNRKLKKIKSEYGDSEKLKEASIKLRKIKKSIEKNKEKLEKGETTPEIAAKECNDLANDAIQIFIEFNISLSGMIVKEKDSFVKNVEKLQKLITGNLPAIKDEIEKVKPYANKNEMLRIETHISEIEQIIEQYSQDIKQKDIDKFISDDILNRELSNKVEEYLENLSSKFGNLSTLLHIIRRKMPKQHIPQQLRIEDIELPQTSSVADVQSVEPTKSAEEESDVLDLPDSIFGINSSMFSGNTGEVQEQTHTPLQEPQTEELEPLTQQPEEQTVQAQNSYEVPTEIHPKEESAKEQSVPVAPEKPAAEATEENIQSSAGISEDVQATSVKKSQNTASSEKTSATSYSSDFSQTLIDRMAKNIAVLPLYSVVEDLRYEIEGLMSTSDIKELQQANPSRYQEIIKSKKKEIYSLPAVKQIKYAQTFAILKDMETSRIEEAKKLFDSPLSKTKEAIAIMAKENQYNGYKPVFKNINTSYRNYIKPMNVKTANAVTDFLTKCFDIDSETKQKLNKFMSNQKSYSAEITNLKASKGFKTMLIKVLMSEFDKENGTNFASDSDKALDNYEIKRQMEQKIDMLDNMDWASDDDDSLF